MQAGAFARPHTHAATLTTCVRTAHTTIKARGARVLPSCACQSAHAYLARSLAAAAAALVACTPLVPGAYAQVSRRTCLSTSFADSSTTDFVRAKPLLCWGHRLRAALWSSLLRPCPCRCPRVRWPCTRMMSRQPAGGEGRPRRPARCRARARPRRCWTSTATCSPMMPGRACRGAQPSLTTLPVPAVHISVQVEQKLIHLRSCLLLPAPSLPHHVHELEQSRRRLAIRQARQNAAEERRCLLGARSIKAYAAYLDTLEDAEEAHPACTANRLLLEHTWQVAGRSPAQRSARRGGARSCHVTLALAFALPPRRVLKGLCHPRPCLRCCQLRELLPGLVLGLRDLACGPMHAADQVAPSPCGHRRDASPAAQCIHGPHGTKAGAVQERACGPPLLKPYPHPRPTRGRSSPTSSSTPAAASRRRACVPPMRPRLLQGVPLCKQPCLGSRSCGTLSCSTRQWSPWLARFALLCCQASAPE